MNEVIPIFKSEVTKHLKQCCLELISYKETGILPDGFIREIGRKYLSDIASQYRTDMVINEVHRQTVELVLKEKFFAWCIVDKFDVEVSTIPKRSHFFGSIEEKDTLENVEEILRQYDRDFEGRSPHKVIKLYTHEH